MMYKLYLCLLLLCAISAYGYPQGGKSEEAIIFPEETSTMENSLENSSENSSESSESSSESSEVDDLYLTKEAMDCYNLTYLRNMEGLEDIQNDPHLLHKRFVRCIQTVMKDHRSNSTRRHMTLFTYDQVYLSHWMTLLMLVVIVCTILAVVRRIARNRVEGESFWFNRSRRVLVFDTAHQCQVIPANTEPFQCPDLRWNPNNMDASIPSYEEATGHKCDKLPSYIEATKIKDQDEK